MTIDTIETRVSDAKLDLVTENTCSPSRLPIKRSLFGKVDHEECMNFLSKELNSINEEAMKRWNFDFRADRPLQPGLYEWIPVQSNEIIPQVYSTNWSHSSHCSNVETAADNRQNSCSLKPNVCGNEVERLGNKVTVMPPKLTQKSIDDYMKSKKRLSTNNNHSKCEETIACEIKNFGERNECERCFHSLLAEPSPKKLRSSSC